MRKYLAILLLGFSSLVNSQTVQTTPNLITSGSGAWTGATTSTTVTGGGYSGGSSPAYNPSTNTVYFGYNQSTVAQSIAINNALQGSGIQVGGYNYSWQYLNNSNTGGTLSSSIKLTSPTGSTLEQYSYTMNTIADGWRTVSGTQNFNQQYGTADVGNLSISFTGKDARWWAGYYGPQVKDVNLSLKYTVDPCATNPAYSPSCANYNTVNFSNNLVPNPNAYAYGGWSIDQSYAINQALQQSGSGVMIHGFQWGYVANANGPYCGSWDMGILGCWDWRTPTVTTNVNITDNNGGSIYSINRSYSNSYNTTNYQYLFPSSRNLSTLGRFNFTATTNDQNAFIGSMWSKAVYTPDPCTVNPLSSTSCAGYQQAFLEQQCASNPLYSTQCSGYAVAYLSQQCTASQLYSPSCPGYASAYLDYQCSVNPLYSTTCSGYQQAYHDQQCSLNPLYATDCRGYTQAYHDQQCSLNPLYATDCLGYRQAYHDQQCSLSPLYATDCIGYQSAYHDQQCSINALYATDCTGYAQAYLTQQCSINPLYSTSCTGYATAYFNQQCSLNGLYDRTCPNYSEAYAKKMLFEQQGTASIIATAGVVAATAPAPTTTVTTNTDGTVTTAPSATGSTTVDKAIAPPPPTANSAAAPVAPVQLVAPPPPPSAPAPQQEKKPDGPKPEGGQPQPQMAQGGQGGDKPAPPTARQQLAERRAEAAKKDAVDKGKNLANEMGKAADMEAQKKVQDVVIQAMGFTPGFDSYGKSVVPDVVGYKPFTVYNNQRTIDNRANQRMFGGSEARHNEMVDSQYNLGK